MATDSLIQDIRYAIRGVRRAPLFSASVAGTIGLGLGILCSAFTIVNAYLFKPIDLTNPHELYALAWDTAAAVPRGFTIEDVNALVTGPSPLSAVAARTSAIAMYNGRPLVGEAVTDNFLNVIGAGMLLGRPLLPEDAPAPGARAVVVLSHEAWRAHFASDPGIVGREITLSGQPFTRPPVHRDRSRRAGARRCREPLDRAALLARSRSHWPDARHQACRVQRAVAGAGSGARHRRG